MGHPTPAVLIERDPGPMRTAERYAGAFIAGFSSPGTRRSYERDLRAWFEFCQRWDLNPLDLRRSHVDIYNRELEGTDYARSTRARRISTVRSWYGWLVAEEILEANPAARVKGPRQQRPPMPSLTKHEMHRFLNGLYEILPGRPGARGKHANPRPVCTLDERAGILLMGLVALRVSEVCDLDVDSLSTRRHMHVLHVVGKGDKARDLTVPSRAVGAIEAALEHAGRTSGPMLTTGWDTRITAQTLQAAVHRTAAVSGFGDRDLTPHALRRSWTEIALADGLPIRDIQKHLGHANVNTTMYYDRTELTPERSPVWAVQAAVA